MISLPSFLPHPFVRGGQLQTLVGHFVHGAKPLAAYDSLMVSLEDEDRLLLHVDKPVHESPDAPVVMLMHGLGGCSESTYILRITRKLKRRGYTVIRFNHRGCGRGASGLARRIYHAGRTEDLHAALQFVLGKWAPRPLLVVAFSLSANMLLAYLGRHPSVSAGLERALAVCPPIDLELCSRALSSPINIHLDQYFTRRLISTAKERARLFPDTALPSFPKIMNLRLFDEIYTAPEAGFRNRREYYKASSSKPVLDKIQIPTTILAAKDDPIIPAASFEGVVLGSSVRLRLEQSGGHLGFVANRRTIDGDFRWMDAAIIQWVGRF